MRQRPRVVIVNDQMQRGYRYALTAPAGRNFDPAFLPELTPKEMLADGGFAKPEDVEKLAQAQSEAVEA